MTASKYRMHCMYHFRKLAEIEERLLDPLHVNFSYITGQDRAVGRLA